MKRNTTTHKQCKIKYCGVRRKHGRVVVGVIGWHQSDSIKVTAEGRLLDGTEGFAASRVGVQFM